MQKIPLINWARFTYHQYMRTAVNATKYNSLYNDALSLLNTTFNVSQKVLPRKSELA